MKRSTFQQFDVVQILTTRRVKWRCDIPGTKTDPNGNWTIVYTIPQSGELMIQKGTAMARIPASDVKKIANYDVESVFEKIDAINNKFFKKKKKEDTDG